MLKMHRTKLRSLPKVSKMDAARSTDQIGLSSQANEMDAPRRSQPSRLNTEITRVRDETAEQVRQSFEAFLGG